MECIKFSPRRNVRTELASSLTNLSVLALSQTGKLLTDAPHRYFSTHCNHQKTNYSCLLLHENQAIPNKWLLSFTT